MENQHRKINGYRELTQEEINLMNEIKSFGPLLQNLAGKISDVNHTLPAPNGEEEAIEALSRVNEAERWIAIGKTHIQQGLMALTRAVAKPDFF